MWYHDKYVVVRMRGSSTRGCCVHSSATHIAEVDFGAMGSPFGQKAVRQLYCHHLRVGFSSKHIRHYRLGEWHKSLPLLAFIE